MLKAKCRKLDIFFILRLIAIFSPPRGGSDEKEGVEVGYKGGECEGGGQKKISG